MFKLRRLYTFMLQTFLPLFLMTFGICLFIVLMQFLWRYIDDMVGKGLGIPVLAEMLMYAALFLVPMALPLAILLSSLMTFGNLGERMELLAMKAAGVSLIRCMRPLLVCIGMISIGAFYFQNYAMPVIQTKLYSLLWSIKQKSPELDIPEGVFYTEITGYNVYVKHRDKDGLLRDLMIYDYSKGFNNANVTVADSGRLKTSEDKMFLVLSLFNGESFSNLKDQTMGKGTNTAVPYQRETFDSREVLIEFDTNFARTDETFMQNQFMGKNMKELQSSIDSMTNKLDSVRIINSRNVYESSYKKTLLGKPEEQLATAAEYEKDREQKLNSNEPISAKNLMTENVVILNFDSIYRAEPADKLSSIISRSKSSLEGMKADYFFKAASIGDESYKVRRHLTEWHKKFTLSFACIVFFFIGAPLGAIIRKGGLGMPVVISVILFIIYYIIDNIGFKMARDGVWPAWQGMWLSSFVLAPLGVFLTYKAVRDSVILNADTYVNALKNLIGRRSGRKIDRKEVIIYIPDYKRMSAELEQLQNDCKTYLAKHKRWENYFRFWKSGGQDKEASQLMNEMEPVIEELANSDNNLLLNKLMDFPIISGYNKVKMSDTVGLIIGICFPVGLPVYLLATYQRKLLLQDIRTIQKTSTELIDMIATMN